VIAKLQNHLIFEFLIFKISPINKKVASGVGNQGMQRK
jgi:hypothetical protein